MVVVAAVVSILTILGHCRIHRHYLNFRTKIPSQTSQCSNSTVLINVTFAELVEVDILTFTNYHVVDREV